MTKFHTLVLCLPLFSCAVAEAPNEHVVSAIAWVDSLDQKFEAFEKPLTLASWQRAIGEQALDTAAATQAQTDFFADREMRARLAKLAARPDTELAVRANAWLRFIDRERIEVDPAILAINERIVRAMNANGQGETASALVGALIFDPDSAAQHRALAEIEARSRDVLPLFVERVRLLDGLARELGSPDVATFVAGPHALEELEATCRAQIERTRADWIELQAALERRLGRAPDLADCIGATVAWSKEAGSFFTADNVGPLAADAAARMGFDVDAMKIEIRQIPNGVGGSAFGISIPDDVRFQGNFAAYPRGYFHELGHAIHMKRVRAAHLPDRRLPQDRALNEGIGEIFAMIARDPAWLADVLPNVPVAQRDEFLASMRGYDAMAVRFNALQARLEQELYAARDIEARWPIVFEEIFGTKPTFGPTWILFAPSYLQTPFYLRAYVYQMEVRDAFVRRLGARSIVSPESGKLLDETLLAPGNGLTLAEYLHEPTPSEPASDGLSFAWPVPTGWRTETIPFPLDFAPSLPHRGIEELRFAPGMFKDGSDDFWTYAFVWWIEGEVAFDAQTLNAELATYYEGLSLAVEAPGFDPTRAAVVAKLAPAKADDAKVARWAGTLSTHDPFATHARVELNVRADFFRCAARDRTVGLFLVSPQPTDHAVWKQLAAVEDAFRCSP
ncbi:MAG: hypothetical protein K8S98_13520 [Planctomycetes bacterium]|nr:hypothetical protein [Planctomycetota bacterium]